MQQFDSIFNDKKADKEGLDAIKIAAQITLNKNVESTLEKTKLKNPLLGNITAQDIKRSELYSVDNLD